ISYGDWSSDVCSSDLLRFPQALIRIDISDAAQHALVQQQRLDPRASPANPVREFHLAHFERIGAESGQLFGKQCFRQVSNAPKTDRKSTRLNSSHRTI